jgi:hypothetical protein
MRYLSIAIALALFQVGIAHAAGPFDGQWKGSWSGVSSAGGDPRLCQGYHGNVDMTITNGRVSGSTTGQFQGTIEGAVANDGKFRGKMGPYDMTGKFSAKRFTGHFAASKCAMNVSAKPKGG